MLQELIVIIGNDTKIFDFYFKTNRVWLISYLITHIQRQVLNTRQHHFLYITTNWYSICVSYSVRKKLPYTLILSSTQNKNKIFKFNKLKESLNKNAT